MQAIIYRTEVERLALKTTEISLSIGDKADVTLTPQGEAAVHILVPGWPPFLSRRHRPILLGYLSEDCTAILTPGLLQGSAFRVRIVRISPAHLVPDGRETVEVSIWGDPDAIPRHDVSTSESLELASCRHAADCDRPRRRS